MKPLHHGCHPCCTCFSKDDRTNSTKQPLDNITDTRWELLDLPQGLHMGGHIIHQIWISHTKNSAWLYVYSWHMGLLTPCDSIICRQLSIINLHHNHVLWTTITSFGTLQHEEIEIPKPCREIIIRKPCREIMMDAPDFIIIKDALIRGIGTAGC